MTPEAWQRIKAVFDAAVSLPAGERARFLDRTCGADAARRAEVESLLAASDPEAAWLGTPAVRVTAPAAGPKETERDALLDALRKATLGEYEIQAEILRDSLRFPPKRGHLLPLLGSQRCAAVGWHSTRNGLSCPGLVIREDNTRRTQSR